MLLPSSTLVLYLSTCALARRIPLQLLPLDIKVPYSLGPGAKTPVENLDVVVPPVSPVDKPSLLLGSLLRIPAKHGSKKVFHDSCAPYWLENIQHNGVSSFNPNPVGYTIFRNVKDYGAVGDGITDDTAAINRAMIEGNRCAPGVCEGTTDTPAIVYFPSGTYLISNSIIDYYYTQIIGNPNCLPTIRAASNFSAQTLGMIDGSQYQASGHRAKKTGFEPTNTFFRQVRNLILDMTDLPPNSTTTGIHWPTAQTTSLQNIVFNMHPTNGKPGQQGVFIESGSGGFMTDLVFNGGQYGFNVGNQQFTTRNLTFKNVDTAIHQLWDWGWTYKSISINNCRVGLNISAGGPTAVNVGSVTLLDSEINNTPIGISTSRCDGSEPVAGASLYLENVMLNNVYTAVLGPKSTYLAGSTGESVISAWADGHRYLPKGPNAKRGPITPSKRPAQLLDASGKFFERSKPQYGNVALSRFLSARHAGAKGDGKTDDTKALNAAILQAKDEGKILFIDAGYYKVTGTICVPPGSKIVGEALASVIMSAGEYFNDMESPKVVLQIGQPGEKGTVELSDLFVSTQGQQKGAILIEYNLASSHSKPSGLWDVHTRIGGFVGSGLQKEQCVKTNETVTTAENLVQDCIAAFMAMHVTKSGSGLYMENNWLWAADHDLDDATNKNTQINVYSGRGLNIESQRGVVWLYGTAVEHHAKYQYQFVDTRNVFMGQIQTETAYYQPNPDATIPFPTDPSFNDPVFKGSSKESGNKDASKKSGNKEFPEESGNKKSAEESGNKKSSEKSVKNDSSEESVKKESSKKSGNKDSSKRSANEDSSEESNSSEQIVKEDSSEESVNKDASNKSVNKDSSKESVKKDSSKESTNKDASKESTNKDASKESANSASGWGLRILRSNNILAYGVGLYSFFDNYNTDCSGITAGAVCQTRIVSIEGGKLSHDIALYNLNTVGATQMITMDGVDLASNVDNNSTYVDTINVFRI